MKQYDPKTIEPKWQQIWADTNLYAAIDGDSRPKYYMLTEFPYPSAAGLHAGHVREYTIGDVMARHKRMLGHNVLYPMGWDAFGLPTENYAIKTGQKPKDVTATNTAIFRRQMQLLGLGFDWSREVNTSDPAYYKWTQWLFLQFFKHGLAYQAEIPINWCPFEKTGLANEEVINGVHERCGTPVEKKLLKQWMLKITAYADRLVDGLKTVDYPPRIADQQINWIGRSEGANIDFSVAGEKITVYTTRPDTLAGATFLVLAPEHPAVAKITRPQQKDRVEQYVKKTQSETDLNRQEENRPKTGVFTGVHTINPITKASMPVWIADYVLAGYGTGAIMAVPAHDERDFAFAKAMNKQLGYDVEPTYVDIESTPRPDQPFENREVAQAIVKHPTEQKYLLLELKAWDDKSYSYPMGGIHDGETPTETAVRELTEETGYDHIRHTRPISAPYFAEFYHQHKHVNRRAHVHSVFIELADLHQSGIAQHERDLHGLHWLTGDEVASKVLGTGTKKLMLDFLAGRATPAIDIIPVIDPVLIRDDARDLKEFKRHRKIVAVVENAAGEILTINWGPKYGGRLTIGGTIEGDEAPEITAMREVAEETGYHDLEVLETGAETMHYKYYAFSKREGHDVTVRFIHTRLKSDKRKAQDLNESEKNKFTVEWATRNQAEREIVEPLHRYAINKFIFGHVHAGDGVLVNSGQFDGLQNDEARRAIVQWLFDQGLGRHATTYRLRDWIFSRQHYWGEPIPIIHCPKDGAVPVPDDQLPVKLPEVEHYEPTDTGESPLAAISEFVNTTCPKCGGPAKRETDTMPNWAGSSWYYLRYMDPHNDHEFAGRANMDYWGMVDIYLGGMEHTTLHLLYSRFWHQFFYDQGLVPTPEPYAARRGQGIVLASDGRKMSKSLGNVVNPTDIVERYGADTFRLYIMFMAPYDETTPWSDERLNGVSRFLYRVWALVQQLREPQAEIAPNGIIETEVDRTTHKTLKKVHDDLEGMRFNTYVSALMECVNYLNSPANLTAIRNHPALSERTIRTLILMLAPAAPHLAEELWHELGEQGSVHTAPWPKYDPELIKDDLITIVVQINGKVRGQTTAPADVTEADLINLASIEPKVAALLDGKKVANTIVVPRRLVNFVVKES